jgi:general secretion pathway protein G
MKRRNAKRRAGFTLMEVLLVIVILLMLGTVGVISYSKIADNARKDTAKVLTREVEGAVDLYNRSMGTYPDDGEGLNALITRPDDDARGKAWDSGGPFLKGGKIPQDPWSRPLVYKKVDDATAARTGVYFHVYSMGVNGTDDSGSGDDIPAWAEESR